MSWGDIYCRTHWGNGVDDNEIGWGSIYKALCEKFVGALASTTKVFADTIRLLASNFFQR